MSWVLDGKRITARYMGVTVTGVVESSRVKYGGRVQHTVLLDAPVQLPWRNEPATHLLVDDNEVLV